MGLLDFLADAGNYESRKTGRDTINGLTISTCYTTDEGYETAIIDDNGCHPVERYKTKEDAEVGHLKWIANSKSLTTITKLGWQDGLVPDEEITLKRIEDNENKRI